jgi:hypothetical protein
MLALMQFEVTSAVSDEVVHAGRAVCSVILDMAQYSYPVKLTQPSQRKCQGIPLKCQIRWQASSTSMIT